MAYHLNRRIYRESLSRLCMEYGPNGHRPKREAAWFRSLTPAAISELWQRCRFVEPSLNDSDGRPYFTFSVIKKRFFLNLHQTASFIESNNIRYVDLKFRYKKKIGSTFLSLLKGMFGCIWTAIWMYVVADSPSDDAKISHQEKEYIEDSLGPANRVVNHYSNNNNIEFQLKILAPNYCKNENQLQDIIMSTIHHWRYHLAKTLLCWRLDGWHFSIRLF